MNDCVDWSYFMTVKTDILPDCGFTGHEYLPWFKLYNMNGRLYDPVVGRFLEPDPVVQDASSTQNLNKYSYCLNNPLKYTDPSGNRLIPSPEEERWINPYFIGPREWGPVGPGHGNYWSDGFSRSSGGGGSDYSNFWGQLITSTNYLSDGEYKLIGFGLNENNQFSFLFRSPDYINRLEDFNNRMALASASNIGYGDSFIGEGDMIGEGDTYSIDNAVNWLNDNSYLTYSAAKAAGDGSRCAYFVRMALEAGGINTANHPVPASLYGPYLEKWGFEAVNTTNYLKGDIAVIQGYPGGTSDKKGVPYGHIQMYNGTQWLSNFYQNNFWPGSNYRKYQPAYQIYRYNP